MKKTILWIFALAFLFGAVGVAWVLGHALFLYLREVPKELGAPLITAAATVLGATLTVVFGRYLERKKEVDRLQRDKKTQIYEPFVKKVFSFLYSVEARAPSSKENDMVQTLREFTPQLILWSGPKVMGSFIKWMDHARKGVPDANSMFLMEEFLAALRKDLGLSNFGITKGFFAKLFLKHGDLFLSMAEVNPEVTLDEVARAEDRIKAPTKH